ncbi:MAG: alpha-amylase family glycosyl hydrolase, partial [bacterium]|nr:alpha-amylase family glycosyl hydrolase [bacterium]
FPIQTRSNLPVQFNLQRGCFNTPIRWNPAPTLMMNGSPVTVTTVPDSGILRATVNVPLADIRQVWTLTVRDSLNRTVTRTWQTWHNENLQVSAGWLDPYNDVELSLPSQVSSSVDLTGITISQIAGSDSILLAVGMNRIGDSTRVLLHIGSEIAGEVVSTVKNAAEVGVPEWNGNGVEIVLCNPSAPNYTSTTHNRLITGRDPITVSIPVRVAVANGNTFSVRLALSDVEAVLGSWNRPWYFGAFSYLGGTMQTEGDAIEIPANWGGDVSDLDPDAVDILVSPGSGLQTRMLRNWSGNRLATLDGKYRGFLRVNASEIGMNRNVPFVQMLSRGTEYTVRPNWTLTAICSTANVTTRRFYQNGASVPFTQIGDTIRAAVTLAPGANVFHAEADNVNGIGRSSSILFQYEADQGPNVILTATVNGNNGTLDASGTTDPTPGDLITYSWTADSTNPSMVTIQNANQAIATITRPSVNGEYYFKVTASDQHGNVRYGKTFFRVWTEGWNAFNTNEAAWWLNDALFYEVFPRNYSANGGIQGVTADLDRIRALGFNAIWLTPIFPGPSEHGYAITDYFGIEEDYGTEADFREFMRQAKLRGFRVILDLVANHTSIEHPFMRDAQRFGRFSPYWDFFDRDGNGRYTYYYDWTSLPNVNSNNPDVIDHFIRASKYWMEEYGVDGYRCDVAWGPQNRNSNFWIQWRNELKKIRPDCFLLAEADASTFTSFENRFDAAMDWNLHHSLPGSFQNIFPGPPAISDVVNALTNFGVGYPGYKYPFRFMENFDEVRYISVKTPEQTRTAATMLLTANQMPMIYAGQELGMTSQRGTIEWGNDPNNMLAHYTNLLYARARIPALRTANFEQLTHNSGAPVLCYGRNIVGENKVVTMVNFAPTSQVVTVNIPTGWNLDAGTTYYVNDLLANTRFTRTGAQLTTITTSLNIHGAKVYVLSTEPFIVDAPDPSLVEIPVTTQLGTLYPNPFNATLKIPFTLAQGGEYKLAVFDILGRQVKTVAAGKLRPGFHSVLWDGTNDNGLAVSSGNYFVRLAAPNHAAIVKKVVLLR